jgi:osmoprotectant transport system permease protein
VSPVFEAQLARLPDLLGAHIVLTVTALAAGLVVAMPAAFLALRHRRLQAPLLGLAGVIQTVPSLALLALMVAAFGLFGRPAALIALAAYSLLPILRNTITGIEGVDRAVVEAAAGMGMTPRQILFRVELPLAAPVIIAGIRTATVWVVGMATLATPVGADSLGSYIFSGLQTRNATAVLFGVVAAAALAVTLDLLVRLAEIAAARRSRPLGLAAGLGLAGVLALGLGLGPVAGSGFGTTIGATVGATAGGTSGPTGEPAARPRLVVGAKNFTEQFILARLIAQRLEAAGFDVALKENLGSSVVFDALSGDDVDVYVDYSGTLWANEMKRTDVPAPAQVLDELGRWLAAERRVTSLGALGFENTYALAMREDMAARLGVTSIADLAAHAPGLALGSDYEFLSRPEWVRLRDTYQLAFAARRSFDPTLMYPAVAQGDVDVITAFSTDGRIPAFDLRVLTDPRRAFPPYDAVLLLGPEAGRDRRVIDALAPLVGAIDAATMRRANEIVDVDRGSLEAAVAFLATALAGKRAAE